MKKLVIATLAGALMVGSLSAQADAVEDAIEFRQGIFQGYKWYFAPLGAMVKGKADYDAAEFTRRAKMLSVLTPMALEGFIEGSDKGDTDAKAEIWQQFDKFSGGFDMMQSKVDALVAASESGDMEQIKPAFAEVAKTCKGCHDNFRD